MPYVSKPRKTQPTRLLTPDLSRFGLRVAFAFNAAAGAREAITNALNSGTSSGGGLDFRGGEGGVAAFSSATQNRGLSYSGVVVGADITVFAIINDIAGAGAARGVTGCDSSTAGNRTWVLQLNGSNQAEFTTFNTAGGFAIAAGGAPTTGEPFVLAGRLFGSSTQSFVNGNLAGSATLTGTPRTTTGKPVFVGNSGRNNTNSMRGDIYEVFIVDGVVPDKLIEAWNSPEALRAAFYAPRTYWIPFTAAGGGVDHTLSAGGSFLLSGSAPVLRERVMDAGGSVIFNGTAPFSATAEYTLNAGGTVNFTGAAPFLKEKVLDAGGQVAFSGAAPITFLPFGVSADEPYRNISVGVGVKGRLS